MLEPGGCHFGCPMAGMGPRGLVLAGYRAWGTSGGPIRLSGRWNGFGRWFLNTLWRGYRAELWGLEGFRRSSPRRRTGGPKERIYWPRWPTQWPVHCADSDTQAPCQLLLG